VADRRRRAGTRRHRACNEEDRTASNRNGGGWGPSASSLRHRSEEALREPPFGIAQDRPFEDLPSAWLRTGRAGAASSAPTGWHGAFDKLPSASLRRSPSRTSLRHGSGQAGRARQAAPLRVWHGAFDKLPSVPLRTSPSRTSLQHGSGQAGRARQAAPLRVEG